MNIAVCSPCSPSCAREASDQSPSIVASLIGGSLSDGTGRRKVFVLTASIAYGPALFVIAIAINFNGFLVGMAISGLGFGMYAAVDLALVADVLPDPSQGSRRLQRRRRPSLFHRAGHPGDRRRKLRRAICRCRGLRHRRSGRHPAGEGGPLSSTHYRRGAGRRHRRRQPVITFGLDLHLRIDGHHVLHWGHGGDSNVPNLVQLCHRHHWSVHEGGWQLVLTEGRRVLAIPPSHRYRSWTRAPDTTVTG
jgi:hypothetical protein